MPDPNALEGKQPAQTYQDLFHLNNSNNGLDGTLRYIYSANGTVTTLQISDEAFAADCNYQNIARPTLVRPAEKALSVTQATSDPYAVDLANGNTFDITLEGSITTMTITGLPPDDGVTRAVEVTFILTQAGAGSFTVSWPSGTKWAGGTAPTLTTTAGRIDIIKLLTVDRGTTWLGSIVAQDLQ
tara:strand:+ start:236508 stop:237062 length:555 start_codon:yes stop_codon:yes gene_type:complete